MDLVDRIRRTQRELRSSYEERRRSGQLSWPVGQDAAHESTFGHESEFPLDQYADYIATSNEVFSAVSLRARLMSGVPMNLYRGRGPERQLVGVEHPAVRLLDYVNPFWTPERLSRMDEMSMGLWGQTCWAIERKARQPAEIWWLKASRVKPLPHKDKYLEGYVYHSATAGMIPFRPDELVWFRYPNPRDEFSAMAPLAAARLAADSASSMMKSNNQLHEHGLQLGGVITPADDRLTFKDGQAEQLETLLEKRWSKKENARRWAVLRYEAKFHPMNFSPKDAEFVAGLNLTLRQVLNVYGIPSPLLNDLEHATLANVRELLQWLWEGALVPDLGLKAAEVREQFLPLFKSPGTPDWVEHDFSGVAALQESEESSWGRERQAIEVGRSTINEVRKRKGEPPVPWGDVWWAPVNKSAVTDADSRPEGDTSPTGGDEVEPGDDGEAGGAKSEQAAPAPMHLRAFQVGMDEWRVPALAGVNGKAHR